MIITLLCIYVRNDCLRGFKHTDHMHCKSNVIQELRLVAQLARNPCPDVNKLENKVVNLARDICVIEFIFIHKIS